MLVFRISLKIAVYERNAREKKIAFKFKVRVGIAPPALKKTRCAWKAL